MQSVDCCVRKTYYTYRVFIDFIVIVNLSDKHIKLLSACNITSLIQNNRVPGGITSSDTCQKLSQDFESNQTN